MAGGAGHEGDGMGEPGSGGPMMGDDIYAGGGGRLHYGYGAYGEGGHGWAAYNDSDYIALDAHVLSTPTVADINNDGHVEILLAVSYFFDRNAYADTEAAAEAGKEELDLTKYVGGGIVCYDLELQDLSLIHI